MHVLHHTRPPIPSPSLANVDSVTPGVYYCKSLAGAQKIKCAPQNSEYFIGGRQVRCMATRISFRNDMPAYGNGISLLAHIFPDVRKTVL